MKNSSGTLRDSRFGRLAARALRSDFAWLVHRLSLALGWRRAVPRPEILRSSLGSVHRGGGSASPLKLVAFSHNLAREGASISLMELLSGLQRHHGLQPTVFSFMDGPLRIEYEARGVSVHVLPDVLHRISTIQNLSHEVECLAQNIRDLSPDLVFVNTLLNFPSVLAAEKAGVPSIWNPRESEAWNIYFRFLPNPVAQQAIAAIGLPRKVIFVAEATRGVWKDFESLANFSVVQNSLDMNRFSKWLVRDKSAERERLGWLADEVVFLCVGTLCERKGQLDSLLALQNFIDQLDVQIRLVFVGNSDNRYGKKVREHALRFRKHKQIHIEFIPPIDDIGVYYLAADVFLLCSRVESCPRVILEAQAFGLAIISTPVFGITEQIPNPQDARFYAPGDVRHLGSIMLTLSRDHIERNRLSKCSIVHFSRNNDFNKMIESYNKEIQDACSGFQQK